MRGYVYEDIYNFLVQQGQLPTERRTRYYTSFLRSISPGIIPDLWESLLFILAVASDLTILSDDLTADRCNRTSRASRELPFPCSRPAVVNDEANKIRLSQTSGDS